MEKKKNVRSRSPWHPGAFKAIELEFEGYRRFLTFEYEYQLNTEPLRIDILVIKKRRNVKLRKNIAAIFKTWNLVEFKSPKDYLSVRDFYKVYGYAGIYGDMHKCDIRDMSITLIASGPPRKLLRHFIEERGFQVERPWPGIYWIKGDALPIQVIETRKLLADNNQWLLDFNDKLSEERLRALQTRVEPLQNNPAIRAYLAPIYATNLKLFKETGMRLTPTMIRDIREVLTTTDWGREWIAQDVAEAKAEVKAEAEAKAKANEARIRQLEEENRRLRAEVKNKAPKKAVATARKKAASK
jgi:hypothetical protein